MKSATILLFAAAALAAADPVKVESGLLSGVEDNGVRVYHAVPYAAPPVGDLRWRVPQAPLPWTGVRAAVKPGPACMQSQDREMSEDCLTLSVWTPLARPEKPLPVMVWIHGGGFRNGAGTLAGTGLVPQGVILVAIQYRLGDLAVFAYPALSRAQQTEPLGNYGLMDQIAALRWVRKNIAAFGGDRARITIFGESAGGSSVLYLMSSPVARGLFHRAISESGGGSTAPRAFSELESAGEQLVKELGLAAEPDPIAALRRIPAAELMKRLQEARRKLGDAVPGSGSPVLDGKIVIGSIAEIFRAGKQAAVPLIIGANSFEGSLVAASAESKPAVFEGAGAAAVKNAYEAEAKGDRKLVAQSLFGDTVMLAPARTLAGLMRTVNQPAWLYHFSYVAENQRGKVPGAAHASDVPFASRNVKGSERDSKIAEAMSACWVRFAATGDPNAAGKVEWPAYDRASDRLLEFGDQIAVRAGFRKVQLDYADQLPPARPGR